MIWPAVVLAGLLVGCAGGQREASSPEVPSSTAASPPPAMGTPVRDGGLEFVVKGMRLGPSISSNAVSFTAHGIDLGFVRGRGLFVKKGSRAAFEPNSLAKVGDGKTIAEYHKDQVVFSQGGEADAVFYIQKGKIKLTVVSERGKEAVVGVLEPGHFLAKDV